MDVASSFSTRRGGAAERYFREAALHQDDAPSTPREDGPGDDSDGDHQRSAAPGHDDARPHHHLHHEVDEGDVPLTAIEQVLQDPYLLIEIFTRLYASFSNPEPPHVLEMKMNTLDHLRPTYRRLRNVQQVCVLWRAVARIVMTPTDYVHTRPSCYMLNGRYAPEEIFASSLLSLSLLPLPALPWPTTDPSTSPPAGAASSSTSSSSSSSSASAEQAIKLYLVSGYSEGEVKIWDVDQCGPHGSHCLKMLQYTTSRWFTRHFRSMALASLVDVPTPTYPLAPIDDDVAREPKQRWTKSKGQSGLISRLGSSSPFSLGRSAHSPDSSQSMTASSSGTIRTPRGREEDGMTLLMQHSVDSISIKQRKKSWLPKKWDRKASASKQAQDPTSPQHSPVQSPRRLSPRQELPRQAGNNWGFTSAPVSTNRDRFTIFRDRLQLEDEKEQETEDQEGDAERREKEKEREDADEENLESQFVLVPTGSEVEERREHLASVFYHLVLIWDVIKGEVLRTLEGHTLEVNVLQALKGGMQLASGSEDKSIRIWDVRTGQCLRVLQRMMSIMRSPILSLSKLPNGHLVAGAENSKITVWDADTGKRVNTIKGALEPVWHFQVLKDMAGLFPDASDGQNTVRLISSTGHWDPGKRISKGQVIVWDVKNARKLKTIFEYDGYARNMIGLPGGYLAVAFHHHGSSNTKARLLILDLNALSASAPEDVDISGAIDLGGRRQLRAEPEELDSSADEVVKPEADEDLPAQNADESAGESATSDLTSADVLAYVPPEDAPPESDDEASDRKDQRSVEEGDGRTWRLVPGTMDLKVNAMVVMPDGRLIGASSDGSIRVWDFSTKSR